MKLKLEDIIALAKQGYKKADIEELINLAKETETEPESKAAEEPEGGSSEPEKEPEQVKDVSEEPDYKKLYEESQNTIRTLQQQNVQKNVGSDPQQKSDFDNFCDIARSFM